MLSRIRARLTYANVMATIAVFLALGGVAYAGATIGSAEVINNSLQSVDLKDNAGVRSADVVNDNVAGGGLRSADIAPEALTTDDIAEHTLTGVNRPKVANLPVPADGQPANDRLLAQDANLRLIARCSNLSAQGASAALRIESSDNNEFFHWARNNETMGGPTLGATIEEVTALPEPGSIKAAMVSFVAHGAATGTGFDNNALIGIASVGLHNGVSVGSEHCRIAFGGSGSNLP
jgi:hypothetical protein